MNAILYIHGKGGSATESEHYKPLFPDYEVIGLDYHTFSPWETGKEICNAVKELKSKYVNVVLIANSIGAFFSMNAGIDDMIQKAYLISPIVDMEKLITDMMKWANVTEQELELKGVIHTDFANKHQATLTVMEDGEHWFHTEDQMQFLDNWIKMKREI